jgi:hypothetical protein
MNLIRLEVDWHGKMCASDAGEKQNYGSADLNDKQTNVGEYYYTILYYTLLLRNAHPEASEQARISLRPQSLAQDFRPALKIAVIP